MKIDFMKISKNYYVSVLLFAFGLNSAVLHASSDMDCLMEPNQSVDVSSPVSGIIESILVNRGEFVRKEQRIVSLRADLEQESVKLTKARYDFGKRSIERNEDLYKQNLIAIHDKDELETDTKLAQMEYEQALVRLNLKTIESPISGYVIERKKSVGEYVDSEAILTIVSIDPLYIEVVAPKEYLGKIKKGKKARIRPEKPIDKTYTAKVTIVDPVVDPASGTFRIRLEMPNPNGKLPSGLKCSIEF